MALVQKRLGWYAVFHLGGGKQKWLSLHTRDEQLAKSLHDELMAKRSAERFRKRRDRLLGIQTPSELSIAEIWTHYEGISSRLMPCN